MTELGAVGATVVYPLPCRPLLVNQPSGTPSEPDGTSAPCRWTTVGIGPVDGLVVSQVLPQHWVRREVVHVLGRDGSALFRFHRHTRELRAGVGAGLPNRVSPQEGAIPERRRQRAVERIG